MTDTTAPAKASVTYWIVALASLAWNSFGGVDYVMTKWRNMDYLAGSLGSVDLANRVLATIEAMPVWAHFLWGLGVWSSILGSILLLARSRHAVVVFLISLVGAGLSFAYQATVPMPAELDTAAMNAMPFVILGAIVLQWWWARRKFADGTLR